MCFGVSGKVEGFYNELNEVLFDIVHKEKLCSCYLHSFSPSEGTSNVVGYNPTEMHEHDTGITS